MEDQLTRLTESRFRGLPTLGTSCSIMSFDPFTYGLLASSGCLRVVLPRRRTLRREFLLIVILCLTAYTHGHTLRAHRCLTIRRPVDCTARKRISSPLTGTTVRIELLDSLRLTTMSSQTDSSTDDLLHSCSKIPLTAAQRKMLLFVVLRLSFKLSSFLLSFRSVVKYLFSSSIVCS